MLVKAVPSLYSHLSDTKGTSTKHAVKSKEDAILINAKFDSPWQFLFVTLSYSITVESFTAFNKIGIVTDEPNIAQYLVTHLLLGLPIVYMQIIVGQYSQVGILFFKCLVPLGHGLSYTMLLSVFLQSVKYGLYMTDFLLYFLTTMQARLPWMYCPKSSKMEKGCFDSDKRSNCTINCINENVTISSYAYYTTIYMDGVTKDKFRFNFVLPHIQRIVSLFASWFFLFIIASITRTKKIKLMVVLFTIFIVSLLALSTGTLVTSGGMHGVRYLFSVHFRSLCTGTKWIHAIIVVMRNLSLGQAFNIFCGSRMKSTDNSGVLSVCYVVSVGFISLLCSMFMQSTLGMITHEAHATIKRSSFLKMNFDFMSFYIHIPQGLGYLSVPQMWSVTYLSSSLCLIVANQIAHLMTIQLTISDVYPNFIRFRIYAIGCYCIAGSFFGFCLLSEYNFNLNNYFLLGTTLFLDLANLIFFAILVLWIYGVRKLSDDIHFMMGGQPTKFWKVTWYLMPAVLLITGYVQFSKLVFSKNIHKVSILSMIIGFIVTISPVPAMAAIEFVRMMQSRNLLGLLKPMEAWGPVDPEERLKRRKFNPRMETRYKSRSTRCQHNCLLDSKVLKQISEQEEDCRKKYLESVRERK